VITADTNIFVYNVDVDDPAKHHASAEILDALATRRSPIALQVAGEFYSALIRQLRRPPWQSAQAARNLLASFPIIAATQRSTQRALAEAATGRLSFWDANLLSAAEAGGCTYIISEDMADGFRLGRLEVIHPFAGGDISDRARALLFQGN
jgi:predicted nucleic acid-binding protein